MGVEKYKTFLFTYNYDDAKWQLQIKAKTEEEARERVKRLYYAKYEGRLILTIPVISKWNPLLLYHRICVYMKAGRQ